MLYDMKAIFLDSRKGRSVKQTLLVAEGIEICYAVFHFYQVTISLSSEKLPFKIQKKKNS